MGDFDPAWGDDTMNSFSEFDDALKDYNTILIEYEADPSPTLKKQLENAEAKKNSARSSVFDNMAKELDVDGSFLEKMDFDNSWEPSKQPTLSTLEKTNMVEFRDKMTDKLNTTQDILDVKNYTAQLSDEIKNLKYDPTTGTVEWTDSWERATKDFWEKNLKDKITWANAKWLFYALVLAGLAYGAYDLAKMFYGMFCKMAKSQSGCYWRTADSDGLVSYISPPPSGMPTYCRDFSKCCGSCLATSYNDNCRNKCCSSSLDANYSDHPTAKYNYKCYTAGEAFIKTASSLVKSSASAILKILFYIFIVCVAVVVIYFVIRFIMHIANRRRSETGSPQQIELNVKAV